MATPLARPLVLPVDEDASLAHLDLSVDGLRERVPELSAHEVLTDQQRRVLIAGAIVLGFFAVFSLPGTLTAVAAFFTSLYALATGYRILCFRRGVEGRTVMTVTDEQARSVRARDLPRYTVLVPAYKEPEVVGQLLAALGAIEYPAHKLEVMLLLELEDSETLAAVEAAEPPPYVKVVLVPAVGPTTKPKACNYGLQLATGKYVTIYDAEDRPDPLQLRKAVVAFSRLPEDVVCLQAKLGYYNFDQNRLTKWFTAEYATWFEHFLPGLVALGAPIPLGGTSNHMRADVLLALGAWDPYNVTEDADLGIRLARAGRTTRVLDSVTLEEANSDAVNWVKQRSRWYKGYLQTLLVHLRHPVELKRELGWKGLLGFLLFVGGTPILSMLNPIFWSLTVLWFIAHPGWLANLFPAPWYYLALFSWLIGNFATVYTGVMSMRAIGRDDLLVPALLTPIYWVLMAVAALKAALQLVTQPSFWEKTMHGLDATEATPTIRAVSA